MYEENSTDIEEKDRPYLPVWFYVMETLLGKVAYLGTMTVMLVLILNNHSDHVNVYIEILKDLILIGLPSPVFRK